MTDKATNDEQGYAVMDDNGDIDMDSPRSDFGTEFSAMKESKVLLKDTGLITLQILFEFIPSILSTVMVGHYYDNTSNDDEYISAVGLATAYACVTGESVTWGFTTALYTLVPQAIGSGDENKPILEQQIVKDALAINMQRSFLITCVVSIPCIILQFVSGKIMTAIGEPARIEEITSQYTIILFPWIVGSAIFTAMQRIMQAIGEEMNVVLFGVTLLNAIVSFPLMYLFMYACELGFHGAALSLSLSFWIMILATMSYLIYKGYGFLFNFTTFPMSDLLDFNDLKEFIKLSMPGLIQTLLEFWVLEIAILVSGYIGESGVTETVSISSAAIMYNLYLVMYSLACGMSSAVNISVAKYIGAGNIDFAKKVTKLSCLITTVSATVIGLLLVILRREIAMIFTGNNEIIDLVSSVLLIYVVFAVFYIFAQLFSGLYRGLGAQDKTAFFELLAYYFVAIPLIFILLFAAKWRDNLTLGACTIWGALGLANVLAVIACAVYMVRKISWGRAAKKSSIAMERITTISQSANLASSNSKDSDVLKEKLLQS